MQIITDIILFAAILIVGFILHKQIKSQESVIKSFESYFKIIDIDKLKQFDKLRHETTMMYVDTYLKTKIKERIKPDIKIAMDVLKEDMEERFDEVCNVMLDIIILTVEENEREEFIKDHLPNNKKEFLNALRELEKENAVSSEDKV